MAEKKKMKKGLKIGLIAGGSVLGVVAILLSSAAVYSATYKIPKQLDKIENNTGLVQAFNRSLYDSNGDKIVLEGVNFGNIFLQEGWLSPFALEPLKNKDGSYVKDKDGYIQYPEFTEEDFRNGLYSNPNCGKENFDEWFDYYFHSWVNEEDYDLLVELELNTIRLPIYWRNLLNDDFTRKDDSVAFKYIDNVIEKAKEHDLYVVLDLHGAPGSQNGDEHSGIVGQGANFWHNQDYINSAVTFWEFVVDHYQNVRPDLSATIATYDILNEPTYTDKGITTRECWKVFDVIYDSIRNKNDNHVITIEGCWSFDGLPNPKDYKWDNVQYSYHLYNFNNANVTYDLFYLYHDFHNMFRNYNIPVYIGEFTYFEDKDQWYRGFEIFEDRNYSWTVWNYKGCTVGWWSTSWAVVTSKFNFNNEIEEKKINISECTFDQFKEVCDKTKTENCEKYTLHEVLKNR